MLVSLVAGSVGSIWASGVAFWPSLGVACIGALMCFRLLLSEAGVARVARAALAVGAVAFALTAGEFALQLSEWRDGRPLPRVAPPTTAVLDSSDPLAIRVPPSLRARIDTMQSKVVMPRSWLKRKLPRGPGDGPRPYLWHEVLHVRDENRFRRNVAFPAKDPDRLRIVALGDSFTYGFGVPEAWTWPSLLESWLGEEMPVEVLNLGVWAHASEDVVEVARKLLPTLEPDLVLYGVCLNDFQNVLEPEREPARLWVSLRDVEKYFFTRSRVAGVVQDGTAALLLRLGLRPDFYQAMSQSPDWESMNRRFARDAANLQELVAARGLPPVVALVLEQAPRLDGPGRRIAEAAETALTEAGVRVIPSLEYYRRFDGHPLNVSRWEGHPNEEAMLVYASLFRDALRSLPVVVARR